MKYYKIDEDIAKSTIKYLMKKPYEEVFRLIFHLNNLEEIKENHAPKRKQTNNT